MFGVQRLIKTSVDRDGLCTEGYTRDSTRFSVGAFLHKHEQNRSDCEVRRWKFKVMTGRSSSM